MSLGKLHELFKEAIRQKKVLATEQDDVVTHYHIFATRQLNSGLQIVAEKYVFNVRNTRTGEYDNNVSSGGLYDGVITETSGAEKLHLTDIDLNETQYLHRLQTDHDKDAVDSWYTTLDK